MKHVNVRITYVSIGMADMAVSNCVGSNIFDILLGLALPWFLQTAIINPGSVVRTLCD